jgi:hypothetical protein
MTDDAPQVTIWDFHPVTSDSGDVLLTSNDITYDFTAGLTAGQMAQSTGSKGKTKYFYNYAKDFATTGCLF